MKVKAATAPPSVLLLTHFYPPEPCAAANRAAALARAIEAAGMEVEIVTGFPNFPDGIIAPSDHKMIRMSKVGERSHLARVFTFASQRLSARNRLLNWLSVSLAMTTFVMVRWKRFDFVIVTMPPITLALPALLSRLRGMKLIVDVRDVFPDVAIKMGYWKENSPIAKVVGSLATLLYKSASLVICVTESARDEVIMRSGNASKTIVASNGFDHIEIAATSPYQRKPGEFVATFVGNMGLATSLDVVIDAANQLRDRKQIKFVLAGGGADKERLMARIAKEGLENVEMLGVVTRLQANALISNADVSIVPLHPAILDSIPTKIFDAIVLGCPVVCCANGEARALIERSGGGLVVEPDDGAALANAIERVSLQPELRAALVASGKAFIRHNFDRSLIMRGVAAQLRDMLK